MKVSNCLLWAIEQVMKKDKYLVIRKSHHDYKWPGPHLHFLVIDKEVIDSDVESYVPLKEDLGDWPCLLFAGYVKKGDKE